MYKCCSPILLLVYKRLDTTKRVFEQIAKVKPPRIYLASNAPKTPTESALVVELRTFLESSITWDCKLIKLYRPTHLSAKYSISSAISWFFSHEKQGIILEDDCLPNVGFFRFCDELLERYKHNEQVMMISGWSALDFTPQAKMNLQEDYYFSKYNHIWGWASWARAWEKYKLEEDFTQAFDGFKFSSAQERRYWKKIFAQYYAGKIDTWDYPWTYSIWREGGLSIYPKENMIINIGFNRLDATHTTGDSKFANMQAHSPSFPLTHPAILKQNTTLDTINFSIIFAQDPIPKRIARKCKKLAYLSFKGVCMLFSLFTFKHVTYDSAHKTGAIDKDIRVFDEESVLISADGISPLPKMPLEANIEGGGQNNKINEHDHPEHEHTKQRYKQDVHERKIEHDRVSHPNNFWHSFPTIPWVSQDNAAKKHTAQSHTQHALLESSSTNQARIPKKSALHHQAVLESSSTATVDNRSHSLESSTLDSSSLIHHGMLDSAVQTNTYSKSPRQAAHAQSIAYAPSPITDIFGMPHYFFRAHTHTTLACHVRTLPNAYCYTNDEIVFTHDKRALISHTSLRIHPLTPDTSSKLARLRSRFSIAKRWIKFHLQAWRLKPRAANIALLHRYVADCYGHAVKELVAGYYQLKRAQEIDPTLRIDYYILPTNTRFQTQLYEILGIPKERIIPSCPNTLIHAQNIIIPTLIADYERVEYRKYMHFRSFLLPRFCYFMYEDLLPNHPAKQALASQTTQEHISKAHTESQAQLNHSKLGDMAKKRKIFLTRPKNSNRNIINIEEVESIFKAFGYEIILPDSFPLQEQIRIFGEASHIASMHGSALDNLAFSPRGVHVFEIFPRYFHAPDTHYIALARGCKYDFIVGETNITSMHPQFESVYIDTKIVQQALEKHLA